MRSRVYKLLLLLTTPEAQLRFYETLDKVKRGLTEVEEFASRIGLGRTGMVDDAS